MVFNGDKPSGSRTRAFSAILLPEGQILAFLLCQVTGCYLRFEFVFASIEHIMAYLVISRNHDIAATYFYADSKQVIF